MKNYYGLKCCYCGQFISLDDFLDKKASSHYYIDSHSEREVIEHYHMKCLYKEALEKLRI